MSIRAQLLSNGRYTVMLTAAGSGFSQWRDVAITRWREDPTRDGWGSYTLLRDADSGVVWSAGQQPSGRAADDYATTLSEGEARIVRRDGTLVTTLAVAVDIERDAELRRITIENVGTSPRRIAVTSYAELVLGSAGADASHPAFSKLFVLTEVVAEDRVVLATRRRRSPTEPEVWAAHVAMVSGHSASPLELETSRALFLGRGRTLRDAAAMDGAALSNTVGSVLDPIFSLREHVEITPGASVQVTFWTAVAASRDAVLALARELRSSDADRAIAANIARAMALRTRLGIDAAEAERTARLLGPLLYTDAAWRSPPEVLARGRGGAPVLWERGISGDHPLVLLRIADAAGFAQVSELFRAQLWWQAMRVSADVVVLDCATDGALHVTLDALARSHAARLGENASAAPAKIVVLRNDQISESLRDGIATTARIVLDAALPAEPRAARGAAPHLAVAGAGPSTMVADDPRAPSESLELANGMGGFDARNREYVITLVGGCCTPMPWINVIANPAFGFLVSAEGGGYTWSENSQQNPLTPWPNDPVSDRPHEAIYIRDEDSGGLWTATAHPIPVPAVTYTTAHGKGYSRFSHEARGIEVELVQFVAVADPVKISRLRLRNRSGRARHLSITAYLEWALGPNGSVPQPFVVTAIDLASGALLARNAWRVDFGERVAFVDLGGVQQSWTADRNEFLGALGSVDRPAALNDSQPLSGRDGAGLDPCAALQTHVELAANAETEIVFVLGEGATLAEVQRLIARYRAADLDAVLGEVRASWDDLLDTVQVRTPDRAMDLLIDDWLLYQTLACRIWARAGYYQASGAYGFRDQLQDVMALCVSKPAVAREHLLRAAARQFVLGDVQHWWLPPAGQGVRTRMTDDRVWLAYVAAHYVRVTADATVLDEIVPFLDGVALAPAQHEAFFLPAVSAESSSLYEHAARALDISLALGAHGIPLVGTGDWNDGMNRVGAQGKGESVWLAWFVIASIDAFAPRAEVRGEHERAGRWRTWAAAMRTTLERSGWDGDWYRRGYYDDGAPLGSNQSSECKIDVIAQSWSVIAGAADPDHAARAMASVDRLLIDDDNKVAKLFTPPFDRTPHDPGYIKAYPPGIRENGGQYTHGAVWSIFAYAGLGAGDRAWELFSMLAPMAHSSTPAAVARYQVEPYVTCADVYAVAPHVGRGGWTWYTGSAGWLYRAGLEAILGFRVEGDTLAMDPCIPGTWPEYQITFRRRGPGTRTTVYEITVENPQGVSRGIALAELDGVAVGSAARFPLVDDSGTHRVRVVLG